MRAPLLDNNKKTTLRGRKQLAQDSHDDMLRIEGYVRARGGARIEPDKRGERPEAEEQGPHHKHEEKLRRRVSQTIYHRGRISPSDFVHRHTARSLRSQKTVSSPDYAM